MAERGVGLYDNVKQPATKNACAGYFLFIYFL